jgi:hypothetical protein
MPVALLVYTGLIFLSDWRKSRSACYACVVRAQAPIRSVTSRYCYTYICLLLLTATQRSIFVCSGINISLVSVGACCIGYKHNAAICCTLHVHIHSTHCMYVNTNNYCKTHVRTIGREPLRCLLKPQPLPLLRGDAPPALLLVLSLVLLSVPVLVVF